MNGEKTKQDKQDKPGRVDEMKIIYEVNTQAGEEAFYNDAQELGCLAAEALGGRHRAQITGLENIAETALKTSDIFDYVKRQTARHKEWHKGDFGKRLLGILEETLEKSMESACGNLRIGEKTYPERQDRRKIYLLLLRQFIRQMAIRYEFEVSFKKKEAENNGTH